MLYYIEVYYYNHAENEAYLRIGNGPITVLNYEDGMNWLRYLEKKLNKVAELRTNCLDPKLCSKALLGYL